MKKSQKYITVWALEFTFRPKARPMFFCETVSGELCLVEDIEHASHFETKLAGAEKLLNMNYEFPGNAILEKMVVTPHTIGIA